MPALPALCSMRSVNGLFAATLLGWVGLGLMLLTGPRIPAIVLGLVALLLILLQGGLFLRARMQDAARYRVLQEQRAAGAAEHDRLRQSEHLYRLLIESPHDLLVVQVATPQTPLRVRGIISRAQIERQLGAPVEVTPIASSFSEIERALV